MIKVKTQKDAMELANNFMESRKNEAIMDILGGFGKDLEFNHNNAMRAAFLISDRANEFLENYKMKTSILIEETGTEMSFFYDPKDHVIEEAIIFFNRYNRTLELMAAINLSDKIDIENSKIDIVELVSGTKGGFDV